jgi:cyanate permease
VVSDRILKRTGNLRSARCWVIAGGLFGGFVFLIPVVLLDDLTVIALCLSLAFFCVELVVAPIWAVPMDIAPRYAGSASGIMNFGFGMAGIISPFMFGYAIDLTGSWTLPFLRSMGLLLIGSGLALRLRPDQQLLDPAVATE